MTKISDYSIERPGWSIAMWIGAVLLSVGLVGVFIAAYAAFELVMPWYQAIFFAALIEGAAIWEGIELVLQSKRRGIALAGLLVSLAVSLTYNYIQVENAALMVDTIDQNSWQVFALALGPVTSLAIAALKFGSALEEHQRDVDTWAENRQEWFDAVQEKSQKREDRKEGRRMKFELEMEKAKHGAVAGKLPERMDNNRKDSGKWEGLPEGIRAVYPESTDFSSMRLVKHFEPIQLAALNGMTGAEIRGLFPEMGERVARYFAKDYAPNAERTLFESPPTLTGSGDNSQNPGTGRG